MNPDRRHCCTATKITTKVQSGIVNYFHNRIEGNYCTFPTLPHLWYNTHCTWNIATNQFCSVIYFHNIFGTLLQFFCFTVCTVSGWKFLIPGDLQVIYLNAHSESPTLFFFSISKDYGLGWLRRAPQAICAIQDFNLHTRLPIMGCDSSSRCATVHSTKRRWFSAMNYSSRQNKLHGTVHIGHRPSTKGGRLFCSKRFARR